MKVMTQLGSAAEITKGNLPHSTHFDPPARKYIQDGIEYCAWVAPFADGILNECPG